MTCDICHKNEATVHLTEIVNDKVTKLHLCENCAKEKGAEMEEHFGLGDLLAGLSDLGSTLEPQVLQTVKCGNCGFTYNDFKKVGRFGCSECYESFKAQIAPLLKRIHGSDRHLGKFPFKVGKSVKDAKTLQDLKQKLERAIRMEEFEDAAAIRDKIKDIEKRESDKKDKGEKTEKGKGPGGKQQ